MQVEAPAGLSEEELKTALSAKSVMRTLKSIRTILNMTTGSATLILVSNTNALSETNKLTD